MLCGQGSFKLVYLTVCQVHKNCHKNCYIHFVVNSYLCVLDVVYGSTKEWICCILAFIRIVKQTA